jgi:hypothetical protein
MKHRRRRSPALAVIALLAIFAAIPFLTAAAAAGAGLKVTPDHADLGTVDEGVQVRAAFIVENTGDTPLAITNVRTN